MVRPLSLSNFISTHSPSSACRTTVPMRGISDEADCVSSESAWVNNASKSNVVARTTNAATMPRQLSRVAQRFHLRRTERFAILAR